MLTGISDGKVYKLKRKTALKFKSSAIFTHSTAVKL